MDRLERLDKVNISLILIEPKKQIGKAMIDSGLSR